MRTRTFESFSLRIISGGHATDSIPGRERSGASRVNTFLLKADSRLPRAYH
jgi:hypothetical protein